MAAIPPVSERTNRCFDCCALSITWAIDDAWPTIKHGFAWARDKIANFGGIVSHEILDYCKSGLYETRHVVVLSPPLFREAWDSLEGLIPSILRELGDFLKSGASALYQGTVTVLQAAHEGLGLISHLFLQQVVQEMGSYTASLTHQTCLACRVGGQGILEVAECAFQIVSPVVRELLFSYPKSACVAASQGSLALAHAPKEGGEALYEVTTILAREGASYILSTGHEGIKAAHWTREVCVEVTECMRYLPLRLAIAELASYLASAGFEIQKSVVLLPALLDEGTYVLRETAQQVVQELFSFLRSGCQQTLQGADTMGLALGEGIRRTGDVALPFLEEAGSYTLSGIYQIGKGLQRGFFALEEGTRLPREKLLYILLELGSYLSTGVYETAQGIQMAADATLEAASIPGEIGMAVGKELISYIQSDISEGIRAARHAKEVLRETADISKDPVLAVIEEMISCIVADQQQVRHAKRRITQDLPAAIQEEVLDPTAAYVVKKIAPYLTRGRAIRRLRRGHAA